jgi:hypothetical protein
MLLRPTLKEESRAGGRRGQMTTGARQAPGGAGCARAAAEHRASTQTPHNAASYPRNAIGSARVEVERRCASGLESTELVLVAANVAILET